MTLQQRLAALKAGKILYVRQGNRVYYYLDTSYGIKNECWEHNGTEKDLCSYAYASACDNLFDESVECKIAEQKNV